MSPLEERFWSKVYKTRSCWNWVGGHNGLGYGRFWTGKKLEYAHRVSYAMKYGPIPEGKLLLYRCDNPKCVRPGHMRVGTHVDNSQDAYKKGRLVIPDNKSGLAKLRAHPELRARGTRHGQSKLTDDNIREIRKLGHCDQRQTALRFGISQATVWNILHRNTWKHVA